MREVGAEGPGHVSMVLWGADKLAAPALNEERPGRPLLEQRPEVTFIRVCGARTQPVARPYLLILLLQGSESQD